MNLESYLSQIVKQAVSEVIDEKIEELRSEIRELKSDLPQGRKRSESRLQVIRPKELAEMLSLTRTTIWRMEKDGELPSKIQMSGRAVGWLRSDIEEWLITSKTDYY